MGLLGKTKEMVEALLLPHETKSTTIGSADVVLSSIDMPSDLKCLLICDSTTGDADVLKCRTLVRWLMRPTGHSLKALATPDKHVLLVICKPADEETIVDFLENGGASLHVFSGWSDLLSSSILLSIRSLLHRMDETNSSFRTSLSAEVERLDSIGVFSTSALGEMKDTVFLASWVANRLLHKFGEIQNLNTLTFGEENPSSVSPLADGWVDDLFGEEAEFHGIDMLQLSSVCNDLVVQDLDGRLLDGTGNLLGLNLDNSMSKRSNINLGLFTSATKRNYNTKLISKNHSVISTTQSNYLGPEGTVNINFDEFDGARIQVVGDSFGMVIEMYSQTFNISLSGKDSIRGDYNFPQNEYIYIDDFNNVVSTPSLEEPYYSKPFLGGAIIAVARRNPPSPLPPPTWREFILILEYQGEPNDSFDVYFRQYNIQPWEAGGDLRKWPYIAKTSERVNFNKWKPDSANTAVYSIRLLNHTLWDIDPSDYLVTQSELYQSMTASYGAFRSFGYKIFSKLLYVK